MTSILGPKEPTNSTVERGSPLSPRESKLMDYLTLGMGNTEIAKAMGISKSGIESHLVNIKFKLGLSRRVLLALYWYDKSNPR